MKYSNSRHLVMHRLVKCAICISIMRREWEFN